MVRTRLTLTQEKEIIDRYLDKESPDTICVDYKVQRNAVYNVLRRNSIPTLGRESRAFPVNHEKFDNLSEKAMYWAGFISADGHINRQKDCTARVDIQLSGKDKDHLAKFKKFVEADRTVLREYMSNTSYGSFSVVRLDIKSKRITDRLDELGIKGPNIDRELINSRHFWRGVIDGDGYISKDPGYPSLELAGQLYTLEPYKEFLKTYLDIDAKIHRIKGKNSYRIKTAGRRGLKAIEYIYSDNKESLDRKQIRANLIIEHHKGEVELF